MLALAAALILASCASPAAIQPAPKAETAFNGAVLDPPIIIPPLSLQRADGQRFNTADTSGRLSLFFFGYTFCPDVCPLTLAEVAQVRKQLGVDARAVDTYFVTVDPERDSAQRLAEYTDRIDPGIVGLTGTPDELERACAAFGVVARKRVVSDTTSTAGYFMDHSASLYLVGPDGRVPLVYPYGTPPADLTGDLKRLIPGLQASTLPAPVGTVAATTIGGHAATPTGTISFAKAWARPTAPPTPERGGVGVVYLEIRNAGPADDALVGAGTDLATAEIHRSFLDNGVMRMTPAGRVVVPAGGELKLEPGGLHIMLLNLRRELPDGSLLALTLKFEQAGAITLNVPVRSGAPEAGVPD